MYSETTRSIRISVEPFYVADQSEPDKARWVFGYRVRIANEGEETVQLMTRHWRITDGRGKVVEVKGDGPEEHATVKCVREAALWRIEPDLPDVLTPAHRPDGGT